VSSERPINFNERILKRIIIDSTLILDYGNHCPKNKNHSKKLLKILGLN